MRGDTQQQQKNPRISQQSDIVSTRWYRGTRVVSRLQALLSASSGEVQDNECTRETQGCKFGPRSRSDSSDHGTHGCTGHQRGFDAMEKFVRIHHSGLRFKPMLKSGTF